MKARQNPLVQRSPVPHTEPPQHGALRDPQVTAETHCPPEHVSPDAHATPPQHEAPRVPHWAGSAQVPALH